MHKGEPTPHRRNAQGPQPSVRKAQGLVPIFSSLLKNRLKDRLPRFLPKSWRLLPCRKTPGRKKLPHRTQAKEAARSSLPEHRGHVRRFMMNPGNEGSSSPRSPSVRSLNEPPSVSPLTGHPGAHTSPQHISHKGHAPLPAPSAGREHQFHWSLSRSTTVPGQQPASAASSHRSGNA